MNEDENAPSISIGQKKRSMKCINRDGMGYSVMAGLGDAYLPAALVLLGASDFYIGLLSAIPQLLGAFSQFIALSALRLLRSRKRMVALGALLQAFTWLAIVALVYWPSNLSAELIIAFFSIGAGASLFVNPAWSSWVADIVPANERPGFFANRNRLMQTVLFATTFIAGYAIRILELQYTAAIAFAAVFMIAFLARLATVFQHLKTQDIPYEIKLTNEIKLKHLFLLPSYKNELWFLAFVALMNFSVQFASPFFTPYMLHNLGMDIGTLGMLTAIAIITKIISYPYWGAAIDRFTNRTVLMATAAMVPFVTFMWLFTSDIWMLSLFQVFSGFVWAGYDLAVFNSALGLVGRELRPSFISKYNAFASFANAAGAIAGGAFLVFFPNLAILGFGGILLVFLLSSVMRMIVVLVFAPHIARGKDILNRHDDRAMVFNIVAVQPTRGVVSQVLNGWDFTRKIVSTGTESSGIMLREGLDATGELIKEGGRKFASKIGRKKHL